MTIIRNVAFFFVSILLVVLISPLVTAYDNRERQYIDEGLSSLKAVDANATAALESFDKAIAINPDSATTWNYRGNALMSLDRYKEAIDSFDKAIAIKPDYASPWYNRGNALMELGRYAEAALSFTKVLTIDPGDGMAKKSLEIALQKQIQAQQTSATPIQQQIPTTPLPQQSPTTMVPQRSQQQTKTTPLLYAPIGAIVLISVVAVRIRRQDPPLK
jgi:tetratricopeptide (TPR) repeat protein